MYNLIFVIDALMISFGSGVLGAMLGLGGGVFMVPLLIFMLNVPLHLAAGASIIAVVATSSAAAATYVKDDIANLRLGMFLELATTVGAVTGAFLTSVTGEATLRMIFGLALLYAAATMYLQMRNMERSWVTKPNDSIANGLHLDGSYFDVARGQQITYGVSHTPLTLGISYIAGVVSGLLGIGGGGIKVPAMNVVGNVPMKVAIATSNFMIGVTAAASALVYMRNGFCDVFITAPVVLGTLAGSFMGARLTYRMKGIVLKKVFMAVLTLLAVRMIASGLGV
jgi:uncharacterized membrane protein YfcA